MSVSITLDTSALDRLEQEAPGRAGQALSKVANDAAAYMKSHMSSSSPAPVGSAPGVVTGNLVNSIQAQEDGPLDWSVWGAGYGLILESGSVNMGARPFITPAVYEVAKTIPDAFGVLVEE